MENENIKEPGWFRGLAIFFLLWNILGLMSFFMHVFISEEYLATLPENERALYDEYPFWTNIAFAVATFCGFFGSVGLLMKKKWCKPVFIVSLIAIIPQMTQNLFFTSSIEVYGAFQAALMPVLVVLIGIILVWFSNYGIKKSWLR